MPPSGFAPPAADAPPTTLPALSALEIASGMIFGSTPVALPPPDGRSSRRVLHELLLPALERSPCMVAFSGGRDSSAMLAAAAAVAREEGLPEPVPLTMSFAAHPRTHEAEWQEAVIRHLALRDRVVISLDSELDILGPLATGLLRRHGLYWPSNAHTMAVLMREAAGGSLITGNGGDEMFCPWSERRVRDIRTRRVRPHVGELEHVALSLAPESLRRVAWRLRNPLRLPWLSRRGSRQHAWALARRWAEHADSWADQVGCMLGSRYLHLAACLYRAVARDHDVLLLEPFCEPAFAASVVHATPDHGPDSRADALERHFGDLLPAAATNRSTKAAFTDVFWGPAAREFATRWDGSGIDASLVHADALRAAWAKEPPDMRTMTALQAAWLAGGQD